MKLEELANSLAAKAQARGFSDWETVCQRAESFQVRVFRGEIAEYKNAAAAGVGFRGTLGGRMGSAATELAQPGVAQELIESAAANAAVIEDADETPLYRGGGAYPETEARREGPGEPQPGEMIALCAEMERLALATERRIVSVDHCVIGNGRSDTRLTNSYGLDVGHSGGMAYGYIYVRAEENGRTKVAGHSWHGRGFGGFDPAALARRATAKAVAYLNADTVPSGRYGVVIDAEAAAGLLGAFAGVFFADSVQKGFSLMAGKLGGAVAAPVVTLRDDGVYPESPASRPFDSEGVPTAAKAVIKNGVLLTYLHNLKTAAKDGVPPTGNAHRAGLGGAVGIGCGHFYMEPGRRSKQELLRELGSGLLVTQFTGLHAGANAVSGDFSLSAQGFRVEGGEAAGAVEQITVAGNFCELLNRIVCVGDDIQFGLPAGGCAMGMPSVLVDGLEVAGR